MTPRSWRVRRAPAGTEYSIRAGNSLSGRQVSVRRLFSEQFPVQELIDVSVQHIAAHRCHGEKWLPVIVGENNALRLAGRLPQAVP